MKVESLKDLEKLVKLCRKLGIDSLKLGDVEVNLGQEPYSKPIRASKRQVNIDPDTFSQPGLAETRIDTPDELSEEDLLFYSAGGNVSGAV